MEGEGRLPGTYYNDNNRRQNTTKGNCAIGLQKEKRRAPRIRQRRPAGTGAPAGGHWRAGRRTPEMRGQGLGQCEGKVGCNARAKR